MCGIWGTINYTTRPISNCNTKTMMKKLYHQDNFNWIQDVGQSSWDVRYNT